MFPPQINRRCLLVGGITSAGMMGRRRGRAGDLPKSSAAIIADRMRDFLCQNQQSDGRWASSTYAVLRSGQALTPFILFALLQSDPDFRRSDGAQRARRWIRSRLRNGTLGYADRDLLEYPVFATAFAARCIHRMQDHGDRVTIDSMRQFLVDQQYSERRGFDPNHLAFGGWGFGGDHPAGQTGHMDLSHVRWALSALKETQNARNDDAVYRAHAQHFLRLVQKSPDEDRVQPLGESGFTSHPRFDGGFYFSPIVLAANKGRVHREGDCAYFRSYATATCDGVLALLASGASEDEPRVDSAKNWLTRYPGWDYPAGIPADHPEPWGDAVFFYHQAVRAEAHERLGIDGDWPELLVSRLSKLQNSDGSFRNDRCALMKEDDPILCTALALIAITHAIRARSSSLGKD
tara:strand:+ start:66550 stop:67767 length:1218 start_codon:yes stop_codon:yes gene_type:complete